MLSIISAACYDSPRGVRLTTGASPLTPAGNVAPNPIRLTPLGGGLCPGAVGFGTSFNLVLSAGADDLTLDSVTLHLLDGSNVGGPSVTIPSLELSSQFGSTVIRAGTTRAFAFRPTFGCVAFQPRFIRGHARLLDRRGVALAVPVESRIQ